MQLLFIIYWASEASEEKFESGYALMKYYFQIKDPNPCRKIAYPQNCVEYSISR